MIQVGLSFAAGLLTALSPCVLPVLPIIVGSAMRASRLGPVALAAGFVTAFTVMGLLLAWFGSVAGLDADAMRSMSAALLIVAGVILLSARLQAILERLAEPLASVSSKATTALGSGVAAQFAVGAALGGVWSPCVGPTLGAALVMASQAETVTRATLLMFTFGLGGAAPLLAIAYAGRRLFHRPQVLRRVGDTGRMVFGVLLVASGGAIWTGLDRSLEAALLARFPDWWIAVLAKV